MFFVFKAEREKNPSKGAWWGSCGRLVVYLVQLPLFCLLFAERTVHKPTSCCCCSSCLSPTRAPARALSLRTHGHALNESPRAATQMHAHTHTHRLGCLASPPGGKEQAERAFSLSLSVKRGQWLLWHARTHTRTHCLGRQRRFVSGPPAVFLSALLPADTQPESGNSSR